MVKSLFKKVTDIFSNAGVMILAVFGISGCGEDNSDVVAYYGPPDVLLDEQLCCSFAGGEETAAYAECVENFRRTGKCEIRVPDMADECCNVLGDKDSPGYKMCVEDYKKTGECSTVAVYGPAPTPEYECCLQFGDETSSAYADCVEELRNTGKCPSEIDAPIYGPPPMEELTPEECCIQVGDETSAAYAECVKEYTETGNCPVPPDNPSV